MHLGARYDDVIAGRHQRQLLQTHAHIVCAGKRLPRLFCNLEDGNEHAAHCENSKQESDFRRETSTFGSMRMVSGFVQSCPARNLTLRRHAEIQLRAMYRLGNASVNVHDFAPIRCAYMRAHLRLQVRIFLFPFILGLLTIIRSFSFVCY